MGFLDYDDLLRLCHVSAGARRAVPACRWAPPPGPMLAALAATDPGDADLFCRAYSFADACRAWAPALPAAPLGVALTLPQRVAAEVLDTAVRAAGAGRKRLDRLRAWVGATPLADQQLAELLAAACATGRPAVAQWVIDSAPERSALWRHGVWRPALLTTAGDAGRLSVVRWGAEALGCSPGELAGAALRMRADSAAAGLARNWLLARAGLWSNGPGPDNESFDGI